MEVRLTEKLLQDVGSLSVPLAKKAREVISELHSISAASLRKEAPPGWRLHKLRSSPFVSISLDMNYRILAKLDGEAVVLFGAMKHDMADRANVNRNDQPLPIAEVTSNTIAPHEVFDALVVLGVDEEQALQFRGCQSDDQLVEALASVPPAIADLALSLYETSVIAIPEAKYRLLDPDEDLALVLQGGGADWNVFLHPSQEFIVDLPPTFRAAVVGSAGTGKTVCAWHRAQLLMAAGHTVGFACPDQGALAVSQRALATMAGAQGSTSYYLVPRDADQLLQLAEVVEHIIIDEAQEMAVTWLETLGQKMPDSVGVTLFYDLNQLGGNIRNGDTARYRHRISNWKAMIRSFPRMHRFRLTINYRNSREIAEHYLELLADALPAKPLADVPAFEAGKVVHRRVKPYESPGMVAGVLRQLLREYGPQEIGVVVVGSKPAGLLEALRPLGLPVTAEIDGDGVILTSPAGIRGHERRAMIVVSEAVDRLRRNFGVAIDAYIAMSRAVQQLVVVELD